MPIPFVLATIALSWWISLRLGGRVSACLAAGLLAILSTDPYLFGNGANFEHFINFFAVAALALLLLGWDRTDRWCLVGAGVCVAAAALVKQVAILPAVVFVAALALRAWSQNVDWRRRIARGILDVISFGSGLIIIFAAVAAIVLARGGGAAAYDDIFHYGRALATDTLPEPGAPPGFIRWITGNADPTGRLPWPFGNTNWLVWWGTASWPFWLVSIPALAQLLWARASTPQRRLVAVWTLTAWAQVALPGLYWPHYYLLPTAGAAITVAVCWADAATVLVIAWTREPFHRRRPRSRRSNRATGPGERKKNPVPSIHFAGSHRDLAFDFGDMRDLDPRGSRLPARASAGVDHSI